MTLSEGGTQCRGEVDEIVRPAVEEAFAGIPSSQESGGGATAVGETLIAFITDAFCELDGGGILKTYNNTLNFGKLK